MRILSIKNHKMIRTAIPIQINAVEKDDDKVFVGNDERNNRIIYLDIDGVIGQWILGACEIWDIDYSDPEVQDKIEKDEKLYDMMGISEDKFWDKINQEKHDWWANLKLFSWSNPLYKTLCNLGKVVILSSPGKDLDTAAFACHGKTLWIKKHFPNADFVFTDKKYLLANENSLLVDDSEHKIEKFKEYGGKTFLWPNEITILKDKNVFNESVKKIKNILAD